MGGSTFSVDDYAARQNTRSSTGQSAFVHQTNIASGKIKAGVDPGMEPFGVKIRECRDSVEHPVSVPIAVFLDMTGSMQEVPHTVQMSLNKLMGTFLDHKASGKSYLGDGYPAIMIGAIDDYFAMYNGKGSLQVGQFESGLEIDDNLGKLWFTGNGGGNGGESYDLAMYFLARHTAHDHHDKRGHKGYAFIIGDEPYFASVSKKSVKEIIGDTIESDISITGTVAELQKLYHVYFIMPNLTSHWKDQDVTRVWKDLLGTEHFVELEDPAEICTLIASLVAANEGNVSIDDLTEDGISSAVTKALVVAGAGKSVSTGAGNLDNLPAVSGATGKAKRL